VGQASMLLGAGRATAEDAIDPAAGIILRKTVGDAVSAGDVLAELHFNPLYAPALVEATALFRTAVEIGDEPPARQPLILERL
jgi:pyrimidine-nucleoside phosphorylase